jgi:hypothetical protein
MKHESIETIHQLLKQASIEPRIIYWDNNTLKLGTIYWNMNPLVSMEEQRNFRKVVGLKTIHWNINYWNNNPLIQVPIIETSCCNWNKGHYWNNNLLKQLIIIGTSLHRNECLQLKQLSISLYGGNTEAFPKTSIPCFKYW